MKSTAHSLVFQGIPDQKKIASGEYRPDLDGLRALAALAVLAIHTLGEDIAPGGRAGVDMFFVLSGFLISGIILRSLMQGQFSFGSFYSRRIRRIFPALIVVLFVVWAVGTVVLLPDDYERLGKGIATSAGFCLYAFFILESNFWDLYVTDHGGYMLAQVWSLSVEEQFYLLWPLILVAAWGLAKGKISRITLITALISVISLALHITRHRWPAYMICLSWRGVFELSLGGMLASIQIKEPELISMLRLKLVRRGHLGRFLVNADVRGAIATALLLASILYPSQFSTLSVLMAAIGTVAFISAGMTSRVNRLVFGAAPMVFIGLISYPIYLWHYPLVLFFDLFSFDDPPNRWILFVVVLLSSVGLAFLTYKYVELPIRFHRMQARVVAALASGMMVCGLLGLGILWGIVRPISFYYGADPARAATEDWLSNSNNVRWTKQHEGPIALGSGTPRVLFLGDSNMQQYFARVEQLYIGDRRPVHSALFMTRFGCVPGIRKLRITQVWDQDACEDHLKEAMMIASSQATDTVVIAACWYVYFANLSDPHSFGRPAPFRAGSDAAFAELSGFIRDLTSQDKVVYLVLNIPIGREFDPRALTVVAGRSKAPEQVMAQRENAREIRAALDPIHRKLRQIARDTGAIIIDPLESLCDEKSCPAVSANGILIYHDLWHLRPSYVRHEVRFLDTILLHDGAYNSPPKDAPSFHQSTVHEGRNLRP